MAAYVPEKECYKCKTTKPISDFRRRSGPKSNYRNVCKVCQLQYGVAHRERLGKDEVKRRGREQMRKWRSSPEHKKMAAASRRRLNAISPKYVLTLAIFNAEKRAEVTIIRDDLMELWKRQNGLCEMTGIRMTWGQGRIQPTSLSVDRIDSDKPYELGNVRLVCHAINCFRGRMTDSQMLGMAKKLIRHAKRKREETTPIPLGLFA